MKYKLKNISGGQIVCDLAVEGKTLRLDNRQQKTVRDVEITPHIKNLVLKGLLLSEQVKTKKENVQKNIIKEKEE